MLKLNTLKGLDHHTDKWYGKYKGMVVENKDPDNLGRIVSIVPSVFGKEKLPWALPCFPTSGYFKVPDIGESVWIEFEGGYLENPIWSGVWYSPNSHKWYNTQGKFEVPKDSKINPPQKRMYQSRCGHKVIYNDKEGEESILIYHKIGTKVEIDKDGNVFIDIVKNKSETIAEDSNLTVTGNADISINGDKNENIGGNETINVGSAINITAGGKVNITCTSANINANKVNLGKSPIGGVVTNMTHKCYIVKAPPKASSSVKAQS